MDDRTFRLIEILDNAGVSANVYRTAVRLWRATANGAHYVRLTYDDMCHLCGTTSDHTVRSHLSALAAAGLLIYQRNHSIHVWWKLDPDLAAAVMTTPSSCAPHAHSDDRTITEPDDVARTVMATRAPCALHHHDDGNDETLCAPRHHPTYTVGNTGKVGRQDLTPTYLPTGASGGDGLTPDQNRALALLTDPDFGMTPAAALPLVTRFSFRQIRAHAFAALRDLDAGKIRSVYVLGVRLKSGGFPKTTDDDHATGLWQRHVADDDIDDSGELERRRRYIPHEYADVILG